MSSAFFVLLATWLAQPLLPLEPQPPRVAVRTPSAPVAAASTTPTAPPAPTFSSTPGQPPQFDPASAALPPNYPGDPIGLYLYVPEKDEFETTLQYEARLAALPERKPVAAFRISTSSVQYDADNQLLTLGIYTPSVYEGSSTAVSGRAFPVKLETISKKKYEASNALGGRTTVESSIESIYAVVADDVTPPSLETTGPNSKFLLQLSLAMPIEDAKASKASAAVLLVCRPKPLQANSPRVASFPRKKGDPAPNGYRYVAPKFSSPEEETTLYYLLHADTLGLWVYDTPTGRVLAKYDMDGKRLD